jgi:hypothetical protein
MNTDLLKHLPDSRRIGTTHTREALRLARKERRAKWAEWLAALARLRTRAGQPLASPNGQTASR